MPLHVGFRLSSPKGARLPFDYIRLLSREIMDSMYDPGPWRKQHAQEETRLAVAPPRIDWIRLGFCMVRQRAARFIMATTSSCFQDPGQHVHATGPWRPRLSEIHNPRLLYP
ncbi:hypothetical protein FSOLCH5_004048 [Fusarium solani]